MASAAESSTAAAAGAATAAASVLTTSSSSSLSSLLVNYNNSTMSSSPSSASTPDGLNDTGVFSTGNGTALSAGEGTKSASLFGLTEEVHIVVAGAALAIGIIAVIAVVLRLLMPLIRRSRSSGKSTPLVPSTPSTQLSRASSHGSVLEMGWGDNSSSKTRLSNLGSKDNLLTATPTLASRHAHLNPGMATPTLGSHAHLNPGMATPTLGSHAHLNPGLATPTLGSHAPHGDKATPLGGSSPALSRIALPTHGSSHSLFKLAATESEALPAVNHLGVPPQAFHKPGGAFSYTAGGPGGPGGSGGSLHASGSCPALSKLGRSQGGSSTSINKGSVGVAGSTANAGHAPFSSKAPIYLPSASNSPSPYRRTLSQERLNSSLLAVISPSSQQMDRVSLHEAYVKNWDDAHKSDVTPRSEGDSSNTPGERTKL